MSKLVKMLAVVVLLAGAAIAVTPSPAEAQRGWHGGGWRGGGWRGGGWGWGGFGPGFALGVGLGAGALYAGYPYYGGYYGGSPYYGGYGGYGPYYAGYYGGGPACGWRTVRVWRYGYMTYRRVWRCW